MPCRPTEIVNLPLNGRSYADLALLAPGVRRSTLNVTPDGGSLRDASYNINGMRSALNNFIIDGVDNNAYGTSNQGFSNQVVQLSPDAVQEFRIETNNFSAEFGRAGGGVINATVKSGTNQFHGAAWDFVRNTNLNAVGFFKPRENRKPTLQQHQFGVTFGGPIRKDKMFFFADYEGYRRVRRALVLSTLPTMEQRAGAFGIPVANPLTGETFLNGVIPQSAMLPFARKVLSELPAVNRPGIANNFEALPRQTDQNDKGDIRYDHYFSEKLTFFFRYSHRLANNFEPLNNSVIVNYQQRMNFWYLQDDFKVSRKLTLNLGLRYEYATPQWERDNILSNFDPAGRRLIRAGSGSIYDRSLVNPDRNNFAPRLGLAYNLTPRTVLRGGFGASFVHFNRLGGENLLAYNLPGIIGVGVDQLVSQPRCRDGQLPTTCFRPTQDGYPSNLLSPQLANTLTSRTNFLPADTRTAYIMNWHFTIQRELGRNVVLDVAYVGNRGNKLVVLSDYNEARFNGPGENLTINARRPVQGFGQIQIAHPAGFSNYHALQAKIERRYRAGFLLLNTFVWSKAIDNASGHLETAGGDDSRISYTRRQSYRGVSGYNQPLNNTFTVIWDAPFGRGKKFGASLHPIADGVLGGWSISQTTTANSGLPVNLVYSPVARLQIGSIGNIRANVTGDPLVPEGQRGPASYLNRATVLEVTAAANQTADPYGNIGRNVVQAPGYFSTDLGVHKNFMLPREGMKVEFRAEFFNLFNRTNFLAPDPNRSSNTFGQINGTFPARQAQLALKLIF